MPKVSVVVPIYNTEEWLPACLDALLAQTVKDIEILLWIMGVLTNVPGYWKIILRGIDVYGLLENHTVISTLHEI